MTDKIIEIKTTDMFEIRNSDDIITLAEKPKKLWLMFKILLAHYDKPVHYEYIYDCLEIESTKDIKSLIKNLIYRLRKHLTQLNIYTEEYFQIVYGNDSYKLELGHAILLDLKRIDGFKHDEMSYDILYRNFQTILPEERFAEWLFPLRNIYENLHLKLIKEALVKLFDSHDIQEVIKLSKFAIALYPDDEDISAHLMSAYILQGNRAKAIKYYYDLEDRLYEEYGIEPSSILQDLLETTNDTIVKSPDDEISLDGALVCNLKEFKKIYQLEKRKDLRNNGHAIYLQVIVKSMLEDKKRIRLISTIILESLRQSDVFSEEAEGIYHILLQEIESNMVNQIENRILSRVHSMMATEGITYTLIEVE